MLRTKTLDAFLESALAAGLSQIGQVSIACHGTHFSLHHIDDLEKTVLERFTRAIDAISIALYDDEGKYRPLKSAPNLRHGWQLDLKSLKEFRLALDFLYPAAIGNWRAFVARSLSPTPLRQTLERQTGMYRVTTRLTDEQGQELINSFCKVGCLRFILWPLSDIHTAPLSQSPAKQIPLLCCEACNLFVAKARKVVKGIPLEEEE